MAADDDRSTESKPHAIVGWPTVAMALLSLVTSLVVGGGAGYSASQSGVDGVQRATVARLSDEAIQEFASMRISVSNLTELNRETRSEVAEMRKEYASQMRNFERQLAERTAERVYRPEHAELVNEVRRIEVRLDQLEARIK